MFTNNLVLTVLHWLLRGTFKSEWKIDYHKFSIFNSQARLIHVIRNAKF